VPDQTACLKQARNLIYSSSILAISDITVLCGAFMTAPLLKRVEHVAEKRRDAYKMLVRK
jgi:hypothetical protein